MTSVRLYYTFRPYVTIIRYLYLQRYVESYVWGHRIHEWRWYVTVLQKSVKFKNVVIHFFAKAVHTENVFRLHTVLKNNAISILLMNVVMLYRQSCPCTDLYRPLGVQQIEAPRISRRSARKCANVVSPTHRPLLPSVLLEAELTPGPQCGWKD